MDCKQCVKRRTAATRLAPSPAEAGPRRHEHRHPVGTAVPTYSESSRRQATSPPGARRQGIHRNVLPLLCATPRPQICCLSTRHDSHHRTTFARSFFPLPVSFFHWYTCGVALIPRPARLLGFAVNPSSDGSSSSALATLHLKTPRTPKPSLSPTPWESPSPRTPMRPERDLPDFSTVRPTSPSIPSPGLPLSCAAPPGFFTP